MRTVYFYEAFDGKLFDKEEACAIYEVKHLHPSLFNIVFLDKKNDSYYINPDNPFNDDVYNNCEWIHVPEKSFDDFKWLVEECGWYEFEQITKPGVWKRTVNEESSIYNDGVWVYIKFNAYDD